MKKSLAYIILICISTISIISLLFYFTTDRSSNGFRRKYINYSITLKDAMKLPNALFGFVGELNDEITLKNYSDQINIFKVSYSLRKLDTVKLNYPSNFNIKAKNIYKDFSPPNIYFSNPYGDISILNGFHNIYYKINRFRFDRFEVISPKTIIVRAHHNYGKQLNRALAKLNLSDTVKVTKKYPLPDEANGYFANDGWLHYDEKNFKIIYVYFYKGQFLNLDTGLNLAYKAKTIDTVYSAHLKIGLINKKGKNGKLIRQLVQATTPKFVNRYVTTDNDNIYILSALKADNETQDKFTKNQSIDVYDIKNGKYKHSFYLPKYNGKHLNEFKIRQNTVVAIFGDDLVTYRFR